MTAAEISDHLQRYREKQERAAVLERERLEKEEAAFRVNCGRCEETLRTRVMPMLQRFSEQLASHGHASLVHPVQETGHTTDRTKLKTLEYATALAVERPKGSLILRIVASPQTLRISSMVGVPHGNCSSVFHAGNGPLPEAEEVTDKGISDFMIAAFPLR